MLNIAIAALLQATAPATPDYTIVTQQSVEYMPSDIAPALIPYSDCVNARMNVESQDGLGSGSVILAAQARSVEYCKTVRATAKEKAFALLAGQETPSAAHIAHVESALSNIEHQKDSIAEYLDRMNTAAKKK